MFPQAKINKLSFWIILEWVKPCLKTLTFGMSLQLKKWSFFFLNNSDFIKEIKNHSLLFCSPLRNTLFTCPVLNRIRTLPGKSSLDCFNYSLGSLAFFIITGKKYEPELNIAKELICIYKTKLYWTILRCLENKRLFYVWFIWVDLIWVDLIRMSFFIII